MDHLDNAASQLAAAEAAHESAAAALVEAEAALTTIHTRLAALDTARAGIIADRAAGAGDDEVAGKLALNDADRQIIMPKRQEAEARVRAARNAAATAAAHVAAARFALGAQADQELFGRLVEHVGKLDALMVATMNELSAASKRLGVLRPAWAPSRELADTVRKLDLQRQGLA